MKTLGFEDIELIEVGNAISFVGTVWLDSANEQCYILPVSEDLSEEISNIACFRFSNLESYRFINQAWLLESKRYTGFKDKALRTALYRTQSSIDPAIKWKVFRRDGFVCCYCGFDKGEMTYDHFIPIALGGSTTFENGRTACKKCNRSKSDMPAEEWLESNKLKKIRKMREKTK